MTVRLRPGPRSGVRYDKYRRRWYTSIGGHNYSLGRDYAEAHKRFAALVKRLGRDLPPGTDAPPETVAGVIGRWVREHPAANWQARMVSGWIDELGDCATDELTGDALATWHATLVKAGNSPQTCRHKVSAAHRICRWANARGWLPVVPARPALQPIPRRPRDVPLDRLQKLFAKMRLRPTLARALEALRFVAETGCRPSEACNLKWSDVDLRAGVATLREHKTAARGGSRTIYLTPAALEILGGRKQRATGYVFTSRLMTPYSPAGLRSILRRESLGRNKRGQLVTPYQLRHTFAQTQDLPDDVLAGLLGHADGRMVRVYRQVRSDRLRQAAQGARSPLAG